MIFSAPESVLWNFTYDCNLNCAHCYSRSDWYPDEASISQARAIAEKIATSSVFKVALGGGEVLFRKDVYECIRIMSQAGVAVSVTTNGWPICEKTAAKLKGVGIDDVYVSIDSMDANIHDSIRGRSGTLEKALEAVKHCVDHHITTNISAVLSRETADGVEKIIDFADRNGVHEVNFKRFRPSGNGHLNQERFLLSDADGELLAKVIKSAGSKTNCKVSMNFGTKSTEIDAGCLCGVRSITVRPNGDIVLCSYSQSVIGNLLLQDLSELWTSSPILTKKRRGESCEANHSYRSPMQIQYVG